MKKQIEIAISYEKALTKKMQIDFPDRPKYFSKIDVGMFTTLKILFAIIPSAPLFSYTLLRVKMNQQEYTDWCPDEDCKQLSWLQENGLRKKAIEILTDESDLYQEITETEFEEQKTILLNKYKLT